MGMIALTATLIINKGEKMKQTAVEWLLQRFEDGDMYNVEDAQFIKHQALELEKEQIKEGYIMALLDGDAKIRRDAEDYYNDTYGGQQ
jgi:hypothetical protein